MRSYLRAESKGDEFKLDLQMKVSDKIKDKSPTGCHSLESCTTIVSHVAPIGRAPGKAWVRIPV